MSYKDKFRKAAPLLYRLAVRMRRPDFVYRIESLKRFRTVAAEQASNRGYFAINIRGRMGFGAMLSQLIAALLYCEDRGLRPVIRLTNPLYTNSKDRNYNWFDDFFEYVDPMPAQLVQTLTISDVNSQLDYNRRRLDDEISVQRAHDLYTGYLRVKPGVLGEAELFAASRFSPNVLGVHYRGTDKHYESPSMPFDMMEGFIEHVIGKISPQTAGDLKIFLATDDADFFAHMQRSRLADRMMWFDCQEISVDGSPVHLSPGDNHRKGIEALSTIYLLSRCRWCIKTTSQLSAWAKIMNPGLKVYIPKRSFTGAFHFPDKQLWESREDV